jgi:NADP-dependent 3-hydroxy acid dehydrogenase YdfG
MNIQSKVALITGASSGIGAGTAKLLAANGVKVALAARRSEKLQQLLKEIHQAGGDGLAIKMDVTDPASVLNRSLTATEPSTS